jgi:hypothetical protein
MSRLGKMPTWQKLFIIGSMLSCSITGTIYLLGHEFDIERSLLGHHKILAIHGLTAIIASIALGSVLPFHLKAGYQSAKKWLSGFTQLGLLVILLITGGFLYYGPLEFRDSAILLHWLTGLLFFSIFIIHCLFKLSKPISKAQSKRGVP